MGSSISARDARRLAVGADLCPSTVERAYRGAAIRSTTTQRLAAAAHRLGLLPPPGITIMLPGTPGEQEPVPMLLFCPSCHHQHVDRGKWRRKPHARHVCEHCSCEWTPARIATVGVKALP